MKVKYSRLIDDFFVWFGLIIICALILLFAEGVHSAIIFLVVITAFGVAMILLGLFIRFVAKNRRK